MVNARKNISVKKQQSITKGTQKSNGYLFPQTVEEVIEFERIYGRTDVILPDDLQYGQIEFNPVEKSFAFVKGSTKPRLSMAARDGAKVLPIEIIRQMEEDVNKFEEKKKKKRS